MAQLRSLGHEQDPDPHPPLIGLDGVADHSMPPRRGDLKPALARLGDVFPGKLLLATDFDGTLAPIVSHPDAAKALPANLALIDRMVDLGVHVAVISGRAQHDLRLRLPIQGTRILGENGIGDTTALERKALDRFNSKVGRLVGPQPGVWLECKPSSTSVHYRGAPDAGPALHAAVLPIANRFGLVAAMGRMVVEARPQRADKARAMAVLIAGVQPKAVIYAGDDEPDHSVFELLGRLPRPHLTVGVCSNERPVESFRDCDLVVDGPDGMSRFLRALLEWVARHQPG
ncbi:MAG: trehalose-phosphatase [Candidatus Dormibacteraceae bacterium]